MNYNPMLEEDNSCQFKFIEDTKVRAFKVGSILKKDEAMALYLCQ